MTEISLATRAVYERRCRVFETGQQLDKLCPHPDRNKMKPEVCTATAFQSSLAPGWKVASLSAGGTRSPDKDLGVEVGV